jgi:hypothetical protein
VAGPAVKTLVSPLVHLPVSVSLAVIVVVVGGAVAASLWRDRSRAHQAPGPREVPGPDEMPGPGEMPGPREAREPPTPVRH